MDYFKKANELHNSFNDIFDGKMKPSEMDINEYNSLMYFYLTQHHKQNDKNKNKSQRNSEKPLSETKIFLKSL